MNKLGKLREKAEKLLNDAEGKAAAFEGYDLKQLVHELDVYRIELVHELDVYRIELEVQNEELRDSQSALEQSRREFTELFDFAPVAYTVLDNKSMIIRINRAGAGLFGASGENLKGMRLSSFVLPPGTQFTAPFAVTLSGRTAESAEVEFIRTGSGKFWARVDFSLWTQGHDPRPRILCTMRDISKKKSAEQELADYRNRLEDTVRSRTAALEESLREKEVLLREIHHRVKNNMQVIISLLRLQSRKIQDKKLVGIFTESQERIRVMALIHETLYRQKSLARIDLGDYLGRLARNLIRVYARPGLRIRLHTSVGTRNPDDTAERAADTDLHPEIELNIDQAVPCGLIVNELISNALKYAFPEKEEGEIRIGVQMCKDGRMELLVRDNGIGLPEDIDLHGCGSMGLTTVMSLAQRQLGAEISVRREKGSIFTICFTPDPHVRIG